MCVDVTRKCCTAANEFFEVGGDPGDEPLE